MEISPQENLQGDRYLHWDDFRHRAADKDGLTKEEQWAAIRMGRAMRSQPLPLLDTKGQPFTFFLTPKAFGLLREIDLHCGTAPSGSAVLREEASRHQFDSLMEEALTSSQLAALATSTIAAIEVADISLVDGDALASLSSSGVSASSRHRIFFAHWWAGPQISRTSFCAPASLIVRAKRYIPVWRLSLSRSVSISRVPPCWAMNRPTQAG